MSDDSKDNVTPITAAKTIMDDPAAAAGHPEGEGGIVSPHLKDPGTAKLLKELPGLIGAIDHAIKATAGQPMGFMLLVFAPEACLHATNAHPPEGAYVAARQALNDWDKAQSQPAADAGAANDQG